MHFHAPPLLAMTVLHWLHRLGGPGLVLLGIADSSVIPSAGSMDVLTVLLAAHHRAWWVYYAFMATFGSMIGSYITYNLARKGGKQALERRLSRKRVNAMYRRFEKYGSFTIVVSSLLPPPFPYVPFLLAAGALQYSPKKFVGALLVGRGIRFSVLAYLGAAYGRSITKLFTQYYKPTLAILIFLIVLGGAVALLKYLQHRKNHVPAAV